MENNNSRFDPLEKEIHGTHLKEVPYEMVPYHRHNGYEIYLFLKGNILYYIEDHCYNLEKGDLVILNKKEMHRAVPLDKNLYERISIYISETYINKLSSERTNLATCFNMRNAGENNLIRLSPAECLDFVKLADCLIEAEKENRFGDDILIRSCVEQLLLLTNKAYIKSNQISKSNYISNNVMPDLVKNVMKYIEENIQDDIRLDDISEKFYLSGTHISRKFKKHTGLTIRSYIVERRVAHAEELLTSGKSVSEAACLSGFNNYSNFIRTFRKVAGITPGQYAKEHNR
ncbi:AraC family transcriptional regulator [Natronospora cellulosivora (SeqCode)]